MSAWSTKDIGLAAWVSMSGDRTGIRLVKVDRQGAASTFIFQDPKGKIDEVIAAFPNSQAHRFDASVRALKSLGHSRNGRGR